MKICAEKCLVLGGNGLVASRDADLIAAYGRTTPKSAR
jgi:hypothetical protein